MLDFIKNPFPEEYEDADDTLDHDMEFGPEDFFSIFDGFILSHDNEENHSDIELIMSDDAEDHISEDSSVTTENYELDYEADDTDEWGIQDNDSFNLEFDDDDDNDVFDNPTVPITIPLVNEEYDELVNATSYPEETEEIDWFTDSET